MTDEERAEKFYEIFKPCLKKKRDNGRFDTTWGDKTKLGLYRSMKRAIEEIERSR